MARRIIWTKTANNDRIEILEFWIDRTKSHTYSRKLNKLFKEIIQLILDYPEIGRLTDEQNIRVKVVSDYLLFYEIVDMDIVILKIWDSRQNPQTFQIK